MADGEELIPGLTDDVARQCLVRVPYHHFPAAHSVCKHWKREMESPSFHLLRESNGQARTVVALVQAQPAPTKSSLQTNYYRITLFEPSTDTWTSLPSAPGLPPGLPLFCRIAAAERELVTIGGWDPISWATTDGVYIFNFTSAEWRVGAPVPGPPRSLFAAAAGRAGTVAVAGGHDEGKNALRSALAYRVEEDRWVPLPDMATERDECTGVFVGNEFRVLGRYRTDTQGSFLGSAEALVFGGAESSEYWSFRDDDVLATDTRAAPVAAGDGVGLYLCKGGHVLVSQGGNRWRKLAALPEDMGRASQVAALKGGGLFVVGSAGFGGGQLCYLLEGEEDAAKGTQWRKIDVPSDYSGCIQAVCSFVI